MDIRADLADLVDTGQVARLLGLSRRNNVSTYLRRYPDFPRPVVDPGRYQARYWWRAEIEAWTSWRRQRTAGGRERDSPSGPVTEVAPPPATTTPVSTSRANAFIGRTKEVAELVQMLRVARLVVVTGPSGAGKTRLVREIADRLAKSYPDGVRLVELASLREPRFVPRAIAGALSVWEQPGSPLKTLVAYLRRRRALLILDNCEHLRAECARVAEALLQHCPNLSLLATSQVPLGIDGEEIWPLPPLSLPDPSSDQECPPSSDAVMLFSARAAATSAGFSLTPESAPIVAQICRRLDGIPLAVELAAARVAVLSPQQILDRLDDRFTLLGGGDQLVLPRHRTLQAAFDWSHDLLSPEEALLLRRLSVFVGGFTLEAVEAVCAEEGRTREILPTLAGLVAKSLVLATTSGASARYRMLETVRLYAAARLDGSDEAVALRRRHAHWCRALAEIAEPALTGDDQVRWLALLESDRDNLRNGLAWAVSEREADLALRLAGALTLFWRARCHFREGRESLSAALAIAGHASTPIRAKALWGLGFMELMMELDRAAATLGESRSLAQRTGDVRGEGRALMLLGNHAWFNGEWDSALRVLEESVQLARSSGDTWCLAHALACWGRTELSRGDFRAARARLEESVVVARRTRDQQSLRLGLIFLGELVMARGEFTAAEAILLEALDAARGLGEPQVIATCLNHLGALSTARGQLDHAADLLHSAVDMHRDAGEVISLAQSLTEAGRLEHARGRLGAARVHLEEARSIAESGGGRWVAAVHGLGDLALTERRWSDAEILLGEARSALPPHHSPIRAAVTASLGRLARARGQVLQATMLCAEALGLQSQCGEAPAVANSIEEMAGLAGLVGQFQRAARLFGSAEAIREAKGYARSPVLQPGYEADIEVVRHGLGTPRFQALRHRGAAMPLNEAVSFALSARHSRGRPETGWSALTRAEREVTWLVTKGLTNPEIGRRLSVSPRTVETHLTHVFAKLGLSSRRELAAQATGRDVATPA